MRKVKKLVLVSVVGVEALLLILAGFNLIQLSPDLIRYTGIILLVITILMYIFG